MKLKLSPRAILFLSIGTLAYISLAAYHSNYKKNHPLPEQHALLSHEQDSIKGLNQQIAEYKSKLAQTQEEETELRKQLAEQRAWNNTAKIEKQSDALHQQIAQLKELLKKQKQETLAKSTETQKISQELANRDRTIQALQKDLDGIKKKVSTAAGAGNEKIQLLQKELTEKNQALADLLKARESLQNELKQRQDKLSQAANYTAALTQEREKLKHALVLSQTKIHKLVKIRQNLEEQSEGLATANDRIVQLAKRLEQSEANLTTAQKTIAALTAAKDRALEEKRAAEQSLQKLTANLNKEQADQEEQQNKISALEARLSSATTKIVTLENALKRAELKSDALFKYGRETERQIAPYEQTAATLQKQLSERNNEIDQLTEELSKARKIIAETEAAKNLLPRVS